MKKIILAVCLAFCTLPFIVHAQKPEQQVSFAQELKPHTYYVEQAELWWKEIEKDIKSENNWYNYFRACRNAQGTLDWRTDFVNESPFLKSGPDIVALMKKNIPNTFMYNYLSYLDGGIVTNNAANLLKAYSMNPDFEGIHSSVVTYAVSVLDTSLQHKANKEWFLKNYLSPQLLTYGYNVLMSLDTNAVIFTQNDNDSYPLWMLQDVLGIRTDVHVINIDFLLIKEYRAAVFASLDLPPMELEVKTVDDYHLNWEKVVTHTLKNYKAEKPLYIGMTLFEHLYNDFKDNLTISGLAFKYSKKEQNLAEFNKKLYEKVFMLDSVKQPLAYDRNQMNINYQNLVYVNFLKDLYDSYKTANYNERTQEVKALGLKLASRINHPEYEKMILTEFE